MKNSKNLFNSDFWCCKKHKEYKGYMWLSLFFKTVFDSKNKKNKGIMEKKILVLNFFFKNITKTKFK